MTRHAVHIAIIHTHTHTHTQLQQQIKVLSQGNDELLRRLHASMDQIVEVNKRNTELSAMLEVAMKNNQQLLQENAALNRLGDGITKYEYQKLAQKAQLYEDEYKSLVLEKDRIIDEKDTVIAGLREELQARSSGLLYRPSPTPTPQLTPSPHPDAKSVIRRASVFGDTVKIKRKRNRKPQKHKRLEANKFNQPNQPMRTGPGKK